jgi:diguanylate cyclase (GGDEF)-like protein
MRLLILILTGVIVMTLIAGYLAMVDIFDPIGFKGIFAVMMGLLFFTAGLLWVTYLDHDKLVKSVLVNTREHALTGLKNRTEFFRKMANQLDSARVERRSYGLILLGIDGFRDINNRMEHSGGDTVLKHVGERIRSAIRAEDLAGHYYGDVFIIGMSNMNSAGMYEMAKKIHKTVTTEPFKTKGVSLSIKASLSIVLAPPEEYDPEQLLYKLADRLKKAKAMGGNRIVDSG